MRSSTDLASSPATASAAPEPAPVAALLALGLAGV